MEILYTKRAYKSVKCLGAVMKNRIKKGIEKISAGDIKKLQGYSNVFRLHIIDYKVLYEISDDILIIYDILPRGKAYKNL